MKSFWDTVREREDKFNEAEGTERLSVSHWGLIDARSEPPLPVHASLSTLIRAATETY